MLRWWVVELTFTASKITKHSRRSRIVPKVNCLRPLLLCTLEGTSTELNNEDPLFTPSQCRFLLNLILVCYPAAKSREVLPKWHSNNLQIHTGWSIAFVKGFCSRTLSIFSLTFNRLNSDFVAPVINRIHSLLRLSNLITLNASAPRILSCWTDSWMCNSFSSILIREFIHVRVYCIHLNKTANEWIIDRIQANPQNSPPQFGKYLVQTDSIRLSIQMTSAPKHLGLSKC